MSLFEALCLTQCGTGSLKICDTAVKYYEQIPTMVISYIDWKGYAALAVSP